MRLFSFVVAGFIALLCAGGLFCFYCFYHLHLLGSLFVMVLSHSCYSLALVGFAFVLLALWWALPAISPLVLSLE